MQYRALYHTRTISLHGVANVKRMRCKLCRTFWWLDHRAVNSDILEYILPRLCNTFFKHIFCFPISCMSQMNALDILETATDFVTSKFESVPAKTYKRISKVAFNSLGSIIKSASSNAKTKKHVVTVQHEKEGNNIQEEKKIKVSEYCFWINPLVTKWNLNE